MFCLCPNVCSVRVLHHIKDILMEQGNAVFAVDKYVLIEVETEGVQPSVVVYAIRSHSKKDAGKTVLTQIRFWLKQQGLDKFVKVFVSCDLIF